MTKKKMKAPVTEQARCRCDCATVQLRVWEPKAEQTVLCRGKEGNLYQLYISQVTPSKEFVEIRKKEDAWALFIGGNAVWTPVKDLCVVEVIAEPKPPVKVPWWRKKKGGYL